MSKRRGRRNTLAVTAMMLMLTLGAGARTLSAQTPACTGDTVQVTSMDVSDAGSCGAECTLREAIHAANANADCTRITFDFAPAPGGQIIVSSPLPIITTPVHILGWSHPDSERIGEDGEAPRIRVFITGASNI